MEKKDWKKGLGNIIFESNTKSGKVFDVVLLMVILMSVTLVILESIPEINEKYGVRLRFAEWAITLIFTTEYILRIYLARDRTKYVFSFFGVIDLLAVIPTYLSLFLGGIQGLMVIRTLRLLRVFTILKLTRYTREGKIIMVALIRSRYKISVFLFALLIIIIIIGTLMYLIEGEENGFTSIPVGIYWAIVTLTTVGYGDIYPVTDLGKFVSAIVMILGYAIIVVPTGIFSAQIIQSARIHRDTHNCPECHETGHNIDANFCFRCGAEFIS